MDFLWTLEGIRSPLLDTAFLWITRLGEEMILILVFCTIFWCINKKVGYVIGFSFFMSSLLVQGMKIVHRVPRPWIYDPTFQPVDGAVGEATGYAFPSGHTQNAAALLGALGSQIRKNMLRFILFGLAILVGFSRLYLGVHYISDVVVSLFIAFAIVFIATKVITDEPVSQKRELLIASIIIVFALIVIVIAAYVYHNGLTEPRQIRDATRAAAAAIAFAIGMYVERVHIRFSIKTKNIPLQILKTVLGVAGVLALQEGLRVLGTALIPDAIRYFTMVIWVVLLYPLIIKRFFAKKE